MRLFKLYLQFYPLKMFMSWIFQVILMIEEKKQLEKPDFFILLTEYIYKLISASGSRSSTKSTLWQKYWLAGGGFKNNCVGTCGLCTGMNCALRVNMSTSSEFSCNITMRWRVLPSPHKFGIRDSSTYHMWRTLDKMKGEKTVFKKWRMSLTFRELKSSRHLFL